MADPLGIIGVIGVAGQIVQYVSTLYTDWKDAPAGTRKFVLELSNLQTTLSEANRNAISNPDFVKAFRGRHSSLLSEFDPLHTTDTSALVAACESDLKGLLESLKKRNDGRRFGWGRFKAAFGAQKEREAVDNLQRRVLSLNLLFQGDLAALAASTYLGVEEGREEQRRNHRAQVHALDSIRGRVDDVQAQQERAAVLQWLTMVDYAPQHSDFLRRQQPGTGQWFLESDEFKKWVSSGPQTLFCYGIPGVGKTILTSIAIDHLFTQYQGNPKVGIAYLYCNFRRQDEQKAEDLVANLLKQLTCQLTPFPAAVHALYSRHRARQTRPSLDQLAEALRSVAALYEERAFIVVDALDECQPSDGCRSRFLSALLNLQSASGSSVNLLVMSRPGIADIVDEFEGCPSLEILATRVDITRYLQGHMVELGRFVVRRQDLQQEIIDCIVDAVDGMFLLAELFFRSLRDKVTPTGIRKALAQVRQRSASTASQDRLALLGVAYDSAMDRINGQLPGHKALAHHVLSWITCAERPLEIAEIQHAWAARDSEDELDEDDLPEIEEMVSVCGGLVTIDRESGIMRLVHYTTQEYFEQTLNRWFPNAHANIANTCASYLSFHTFSAGGCQTLSGLAQRCLANPLFDYASRYWARHASEASEGSDQLLGFLRKRRNVEAAYQCPSIDRRALRTAMRPQASSGLPEVFLDYLPSGTNSFHLAARFGIDAVIMPLLACPENLDPDAKDDGGCTPLSRAAEQGYVAVVRKLLASGRVDVNKEDPVRRTALHYAARIAPNRSAEALETAKALLAAEGINPDPRDIFKQSPLCHAATSGNEAVAQALAATEGVDVNAREMLGRTPLAAAAGNGHLATVQALLATGRVDINASDDAGLTPLDHAVSRGHKDVEVLLRGHGAKSQGQEQKSENDMNKGV